MALAEHLLLRAIVAVQEARSQAADEDGQTLAEYSLLLTIVAVGVVVGAVIVFRGALAGAFESVIDCFADAC